MKRTTDLARITSLDAATPARRRAPIIIGAVAAAALVFGGAGAAFAATAELTSDSSSDSATTTTERPAHVPHIHGTVVSVSGDTVTVTDKDGFTRTIVTSGDTEYGDGLIADLATGTEIHASGTVNSNGTSLDATKISTAPAAPAAGEGPRGPQGDHGTPPTDAPAPSGTQAPVESSSTDS
ncbi:DUF5666 domain-containing protein [Cryobacterium roopkundense]|nr:DUF5666 domain-containing protein [Cryobacterium roopkundense]MBB5639841.1 hypothetical protein [Cryobacterium roopkundense]